MKDGDLLIIEKLVHGGTGLGFLEGKPVFVPLTAPGDELIMADTRKVRGAFFGEMEKLVKQSPERREAPCPWYGDCGGCDWMHLLYPSQLAWKGAVLTENLARVAKISWDKLVTAVPSPEEWGWRHRARLQFSGGKLGFFRRSSHDVVPWDRCLILAEPLNAMVPVLREVISREEVRNAAGAVEMAASPNGDGVTLVWHLAPGQAKENGGFLDHVKAAAQKGGLEVVGQALIDGTRKVSGFRGKWLTFTGSGAVTHALPGTFFQVNPGVNDMMVKKILHILAEYSTGSLLDLYCGNGNFSLPAAAAGMQVTGVDGSETAIRDARRSSVPGAHFICEDVQEYFKTSGRGTFDAVIMDPPRTGLRPGTTDVLAGIADLLVYVSCDPATLARDVRLLVDLGYDLVNAEVFDMFPNSSHLETLAVLTRGGRS